MKDGNLSNKQFITIAIVIVLCGVAILGHDYFLAKRSKVYEDMSILLAEEPSGVEQISDDVTQRVDSNQNSNRRVNDGDTSGRVKKKNYTYNYVGRLKIPSIGLNRGFLKYGSSGNNVDQNIEVIKGSQYPSVPNSNFIIAAHNGTGWNAYFKDLNKLKKGAKAYVTYEGKQYNYELVKKYKDPKADRKIKLYESPNTKQLTLVTCKGPDYKKYYLVLAFELTSEFYL